MIKKTDWLEVARAGISTTSVTIDARDQAIISILERFQKPLIQLFRRYAGKQDLFSKQCAEDVFDDFSAYVFENRKKIFRKADPKKGKLRNYIYTIALRFFQRNQKKYFLPFVPLDTYIPFYQSNASIDKDFEVDYVQSVVHYALAKLKRCSRLREENTYRMFYRKFFDSSGKVTAIDLAKESGEFPESCSLEEQEKIAARIHQRLHKARELFHKFLVQEIKTTLMLESHEEIPEEEKQIFCDYIHWISMDNHLGEEEVNGITRN